MSKLMDSVQKGKSNGQRKAYDHLIATGIFGVAEKIAEARKPKQQNRRNRKQ